VPLRRQNPPRLASTAHTKAPRARAADARGQQHPLPSAAHLPGARRLLRAAPGLPGRFFLGEALPGSWHHEGALRWVSGLDWSTAAPSCATGDFLVALALTLLVLLIAFAAGRST
jgi:hypothetical protein